MQTTAVRDGDNWVLNGRKVFITGAGNADFGIVMAVTDKEEVFVARIVSSATRPSRDENSFRFVSRSSTI